MAPRSPSLHQVASAAGVSVTTVSRYVKGELALTAGTEERVRAAMASLGYVPGSTGQRPPQRRGAGPSVIGLVVPEVGDAYFGRAADAVVRAARSHDLSVLVASTLNHSALQLAYVDLFASREFAGLVYTGAFETNEALARAVGSGTSVVVMDEHVSGLAPVDAVLVDDYSGGYQATALLTSLGHRRIAFVGGLEELRSVRQRQRGWSDALVRVGADPDDQVVLHGAYSHDFGANALSYLLAAPRPPTAVFAASDSIALGVMGAARHTDVTVPGDLSVVGFDDVPAAALVTPRLTTLHTPLDRMAEAAVALLVARMADPSRPVREVVVPVGLVRGGSVAPLVRA